MNDNKPARRAPSVLCSAHKRNGEPCGRPPALGATVCISHGARAPQVQRRARQRILESADKAAYQLVQIMLDESVPPATRVRAAESLLDRAGLGGKTELEVTVSRFEGVVADILIDVEADDDDLIEYAEVVDDLPDVPMTDEQHDSLTEERERARRRSIRNGGSGARIEPTKVKVAPPQEMDPLELDIIKSREEFLGEAERGRPAARRKRRIR